MISQVKCLDLTPNHKGHGTRGFQTYHGADKKFNKTIKFICTYNNRKIEKVNTTYINKLFTDK